MHLCPTFRSSDFELKSFTAVIFPKYVERGITEALAWCPLRVVVISHSHVAMPRLACKRVAPSSPVPTAGGQQQAVGMLGA